MLVMTVLLFTFYCNTVFICFENAVPRTIRNCIWSSATVSFTL